MSVSAKVGQTFTFTAVNDDAAGAADPNAIDSWAEVDSTGAAASSGFIGAITASGASATAPAVAAGSGFVAATATDPDGNVVASPPFAFTVLAATDTTQVIVSGTAA